MISHSLLILYIATAYIPLLNATTSAQSGVRMQLLQLMKQHQDLTGISWPTLENIQKSMVADPLLKKLIALEIQVRQLSGLGYGEPCDASRQLKLDNFAGNSSSPLEILSWQQSLLASQTPFCNWLQHLYCLPETWTCSCREGLVLDTSNQCVIPVGANCGPNVFKQHLYFNPFLNLKSLVPQPPPTCDSELVCKHRPLFLRKKCWCKDSNSSDFPIFPKKSDYLDLKHDIQELFCLDHGQSCHPEFQQTVLNPSEYDLVDTQARVASLRNVLNFPIKLCNISKHLNCSEVTRVCECWRSTEDKTLIYDATLGNCVAPRSLPCGNTSLEAQLYAPEGPTVWSLENAFVADRNLRVQCSHRTECRYNPIQNQHCACTGHFFGEDCLVPGSNFTQALGRPKTYLPSIFVTEVDNVYDEVNDKMAELETRLCLSVNSPCEIIHENKMDSIDHFWSNFSSYWGLGTDISKVETRDSLEMLLSVKNMAGDIITLPTTKLCDRSLGYRCSKKSSQCICPKGTTLQNLKCRILAGHECDLSRRQFSLPCVKYAKCQPGIENNLKGICKCTGKKTGIKDKGRSICEKDSETHPDDGEGGIVTPLPISPPTVPPNKTRIPKVNVGRNGTSEPEVIPPPRDHHVHVNEIHEHLAEMGTHRVAELDEQCDIKDNNKFLEIAQQFSDANKFHHNVSARGPEDFIRELTYLLAKGNLFCNIQKHFICSPLFGTCQCRQGLIQTANGECRIPGQDECMDDANLFKQRDLVKDFVIPVPICMEGFTCTRNYTNPMTLCYPR